MTVLSQSLFTFVSRHLVSFFLLTARHSLKFYVSYLSLEMAFVKVLAGLKEGMLCSGMMIVVFFEMFLAVFWALFFRMKLPKPRK